MPNLTVPLSPFLSNVQILDSKVLDFKILDSKIKPFYLLDSIPQTLILMSSSRGVLRQPARMAGVVTMVDNGKGEVGYLIIIVIIISNRPRPAFGRLGLGGSS